VTGYILSINALVASRHQLAPTEMTQEDRLGQQERSLENGSAGRKTTKNMLYLFASQLFGNTNLFLINGFDLTG
jgi:hypothetical protein